MWHSTVWCMHISLKRQMIIICALLDGAIKMDEKPKLNDIHLLMRISINFSLSLSPLNKTHKFKPEIHEQNIVYRNFLIIYIKC